MDDTINNGPWLCTTCQEQVDQDPHYCTAHDLVAAPCAPGGDHLGCSGSYCCCTCHAADAELDPFESEAAAIQAWIDGSPVHCRGCGRPLGRKPTHWYHPAVYGPALPAPPDHLPAPALRGELGQPADVGPAGG